MRTWWATGPGGFLFFLLAVDLMGKVSIRPSLLFRHFPKCIATLSALLKRSQIYSGLSQRVANTLYLLLKKWSSRDF
jgi:hypothetical protein